MSFFGATTSTTAAPSDKDIEVADPPPDSISTLAFSPQADYLAVGSWDNNVRVLPIPTIAGQLIYSSPGPHLRSRREWTNPGKSHVLASRASSKCMLEQGVPLRVISLGNNLIETCRMELVLFQQEPIAPAECTMFKPVKPPKSRNTTLPSASVSTSIHPVVESSSPEVGIRQSRFEVITLFGYSTYLPVYSTGISGVRTQYPLLLSPNVAIAWMYPTHSW